jgi:hypothetical protein
LNTSEDTLVRFGYKYGSNGAHSARSMMLDELSLLFSANGPDAERSKYQKDICDLNLLSKPTIKARLLTYRHLCDLYGMTNDIAVFRIFRKLWTQDAGARPVLALQVALLRDPLLRLSREFMLSRDESDVVLREQVEEILKAPNPDRFSPASLKSFAQNINGTWTQAGFLKGKNKKVRSQPKVSPANVAFALFLTYLEGASGERLLTGPHCKLFGLNEHHINELAIAAGHRGLIDFKQSGGVTEIRFPEYLTAEEESWLYE